MTDLVGHARSKITRSAKLDVFNMPSTDLSITARREVRYSPKTTGITPISFEIDPIGDWIDMDNSYIEFLLTVKKSDDGNLAAGDVVVLANNLAHTLCRQISVKLNGTLLGPQTDNYHHQAYIETLLNYDRDDGEDLLAAQGWYNCLEVADDGVANTTQFTANRLDPTNAAYAALNQGLKNVVDARVKFFGGNQIALRFTPHLEAFRLGKLLRPQVRIQMEIFLNNPNLWTIRHDGAVTLKISEAELKARLYLYHCRVQPSIYREILQQGNGGQVMTYPVVRGDMRSYSHAADNRHFECLNPFQGNIPNRIVVCLLKQAAFNGTVTHNPFGYELFNLSTAKLMIGSEEYPYETLELNHDNGNMDLRGFYRFLQASGALARGRGNLVKPDDWGYGPTKRGSIIVFDTTANQALDSPILNPKQVGEVRLVLDFGANPGSLLTVLVYGEFENIIEIDGKGAVIYDITK